MEAFFPKEYSNNPTFPPPHTRHFCENILDYVCMMEGNDFQKDIRPEALNHVIFIHQQRTNAFLNYETHL